MPGRRPSNFSHLKTFQPARCAFACFCLSARACRSHSPACAVIQEMGFSNITLLTALVLANARKRPFSLPEVFFVNADLSELMVDVSWLLHQRRLSRAASIAILVAYCNPTPENISCAMMLALFQPDGVVAHFLDHLHPLKPVKSPLPSVTFVAERGSNTFVAD